MRRTKTDTTTPTTIPGLRRLVTDLHLAAAWDVSQESLQGGRIGRGEFATLPFIRVGRACRYDLGQVEAWLASRTVGGTRKGG